MLFALVSMMYLAAIGAITYAVTLTALYILYRRTGGRKSFAKWRKAMGF